MSHSNNSFTSSPPVTSARASIDSHANAPLSGTRPHSVVSSRSLAGVETALGDTLLATSSTGNSTVAPVIHTYNVSIANAMVDLVIRITTPKQSQDSTLTLTCQAGGVERIMGEPQVARLPDPAQAEFTVYFIPRESPPLNASFKFRIWLSSPGLQIRLWAEDELWIGAQLPFPAIPGAHLARLAHSSPLFHTYHGTVGGAALVYTVSINQVPYAPSQDEYLISLRYDCCGTGRELCNNMRVRLSCGIDNITFIIYSIRQSSEPRGARHKFRFWIRSALGGICQRLWAADDIWIGSRLDFEAVQHGTAIFAQRGDSRLTTARADPFSDPSDLPAYSPNPPADEYQ